MSKKDLDKPFFLIHPDSNETERFDTIEHAQKGAELLCAELGPAIVEIYAMVRVGCVDCLVSDEEYAA